MTTLVDARSIAIDCRFPDVMTATDQTKTSLSFRASESLRILRDHAYSLRDVPAPDEPASVGRGSASARERREPDAEMTDEDDATDAREGSTARAGVRSNSPPSAGTSASALEDAERRRDARSSSPAREGAARRDAEPIPRVPVPAPISSGDRREFQEAQEALTRGTLEVRRVGAEVRDRRAPSLERVS